MTAKIKITRNTNTINRLKELIENLQILSSLNSNDVEIDLSGISWVTPLSILPLASKISNFSNYKIVLRPEENVANYIDTVCFPRGTDIANLKGTQSYLPILKIPLTSNVVPAGVRKNHPLIDEIINKYFQEILINFLINVADRKNLTNAIGYFLTEMASNVSEHAMADSVWLMSQYWAANSECEICFMDSGRGLTRAYLAAGIEVQDDIDALKNAVSGKSAKGKERGFGISSNIKLFTESPLKGEIVIISGSAGYLRTWDKKPIFFNLHNSYWKGSIIMVKFKRPDQEVDIYEYIQ